MGDGSDHEIINHGVLELPHMDGGVAVEGAAGLLEYFLNVL